MNTARIKHLQDAHRALNKQIDTMERTGVYDDLLIETMKKQRLQLKDKIAILDFKHQATTDESAAQIHARNNGLEL